MSEAMALASELQARSIWKRVARSPTELDRLYTWMSARFVDATVKQDADPIREVRKSSRFCEAAGRRWRRPAGAGNGRMTPRVGGSWGKTAPASTRSRLLDQLADIPASTRSHAGRGSQRFHESPTGATGSCGAWSRWRRTAAPAAGPERAPGAGALSGLCRGRGPVTARPPPRHAISWRPISSRLPTWPTPSWRGEVRSPASSVARRPSPPTGGC